MAGLQPKSGPKDGAQFHFSLPGSVQGFRSTSHLTSPATVNVTHGDKNGAGCLYICINDLKNEDECVEAMSEIFTSPEVLQVDRNYDIMASPLMYPGQTIKAEIQAEQDNTSETSIKIRLKFYKEDNSLGVVDSPPLYLQPGQQGIIEWTIPESLQNFPIQQVGLAMFHTQKDSSFDGKIALQSLRWNGVPKMTLYRPTTKSKSFWERAWINSVDIMHTNMGPS